MPERGPQDTPQTMPPVAVVVVNWNGREVLADCLGSLAQDTYPDLRLILVDNGSTDDSLAWVRRHHPDVELIESPENLRWAGGCNLALEALNAEGFRGPVLMLNNDTVVPEGSVDLLVRGLLGEPQAWAATPRICYASDPGRIWYEGGIIGRWCGWVRHHGIRTVAGDMPLASRFIDYGTGCALLLDRRARDQVGLFDEGFHFYGEDADYSLRILAAGGRILHVPRSIVLHKVSMSVGESSPLKVWLRSRSHLRLLRKHWRWYHWPLLAVCQVVYLAGHSAFHLWHGRMQTAAAVWLGILDEIRGRPY